MQAICIIADHLDNLIGIQLARLFQPRLVAREDLAAAQSTRYAYVDIDLADRSDFTDLARWVHRLPKERVVVFAVDPGVRLQATQACALGATDLVTRPVDGKALLGRLLGDVGSLIGEPAPVPDSRSSGIAAGLDALQSIFASTLLGEPISSAKLDQASVVVVSQIEAGGLGEWIDSVRMHHSQTFQHCLLVTGVLVAFGCHLGFSRADRNKLAVAGLLHDVGKAKIPLAILEKPGPLDQAEMATMRRHPELGFAALQSADGLRADILDPVLHHHEYLDGSGYPHGLGGSDLSDLVRVMTISDIYGALLERRSYKEPLSGAAAYGAENGPQARCGHHQGVCTDCTDARLTPPRENGASV
jgi:putative nucleotidyltransferase with HDIG domain